MNSKNTLLTTRQAAAKLGVARRTIHKYLSLEPIPGACKLGRDWILCPESLKRLREIRDTDFRKIKRIPQDKT